MSDPNEIVTRAILAEALDAAISASEKRTSLQIADAAARTAAAVLKRTDAQFAALRGEMNARFEQVERRFEQVDRRFEQIDARLIDMGQQIANSANAIMEHTTDLMMRFEERYADLPGRVAAIERRLDAKDGL